jgi:hypothetical protein
MGVRFAAGLAGALMLVAAPAVAGDCLTLAALSPTPQSSAAMTTSPDLSAGSMQVSEWVGAPCMTDSDCNKNDSSLKCENSACVKSGG